MAYNLTTPGLITTNGIKNCGLPEAMIDAAHREWNSPWMSKASEQGGRSVRFVGQISLN